MSMADSGDFYEVEAHRSVEFSDANIFHREWLNRNGAEG